MGTYSRKLRELIEEFDAMEDEDMLELAKEAYKLGCKEGKRKAMEGYGNRMEEDEDDEFEDDDEFREMWERGGYGNRGGGRGSSGGRAPDATRDDIVDNHEGGPVSPS